MTAIVAEVAITGLACELKKWILPLLQSTCTFFELSCEAYGVRRVHFDGVPFRRAWDRKPIENDYMISSLETY